MGYTGFIMLWEVNAPLHGTIHVNAFSEKQALEVATNFIKSTPLFERSGEACLRGMTAKQKALYDFVIIP